MSDWSTIYGGRRKNALGAYQNMLNSITNRKNQVEADYSKAVGDTNAEQPNVLRAVLNNYSGRGMAYSSGYGYADQESKNAYAKKLADLSSGKTQSIGDLTGQETSAYGDYQTELGNIDQQEADSRSSDPAAAQLAAAPVVNATGQLGAPKPVATAVVKKPVISKAAYLKAHPVLAGLQKKPADLKAFLAKHPGIAAEWRAY